MKKIIVALTCLISLGCYQRCRAQNPQHKIDSLLNVLKTANEDTSKVNTLNRLIRQIWEIGNFELAKKYADDAVQLSKKINFKKGEADTYQNIGIIYEDKGKFSDALKTHFAALKIREEIGNKYPIATSYNDIGAVYEAQGNYSEALKNYFASLKIFEKISNKNGIATCSTNIANIYKYNGDYSDALKNSFIALNIFEQIGNKNGIATCYNNIGIIFEIQLNYSDALKYYFLSLKIFEETGDKFSIASCYNNIGNVYDRKGNYPEAMKKHFYALKIRVEIGDQDGIATSYINLGLVSTKLKKYSNAKKYLDNALSLSKVIGSVDAIKDSYQGLAGLDSADGNYKQSLEYYKLYSIYKDSIFNETSSQQTTEMKTKYESEKKEKEIALLTKDKEVQNLEIKKQKLLKNSFIGGLVLMSVLVFLGYRTYRTKQLLKLQTLRNKIASDLHDEVGSTLSSISIFSEIAKEQSNEITPMLEQIGDSSRKMLDAMADIVWTINPDNDQFEKIILRMKSFAYELLGAKKMDFEFEVDENVSKMKLPMDVRKNLYLIFKEATNNMVKYSGADKASFSISGNKEKLTMLIRDNGKGFNVNMNSQGNGLKNMRKRAIEIGGKLLIESEHDTGTTIQLLLNFS